MSEITVNAQLIKYDASGNQTIINPKTLAQDVTITANTNKSSITNLQSLITALGSLAFVSRTIVTSVDNCASGVLVDGSVVNEIYTKIQLIDEELNSMSTMGSDAISIQLDLNDGNDITGTWGTAPYPFYTEMTLPNGNTYELGYTFDLSSNLDSITEVTAEYAGYGNYIVYWEGTTIYVLGSADSSYNVVYIGDGGNQSTVPRETYGYCVLSVKGTKAL